MNHCGSPSPDGGGIPKPTRAMFPAPNRQAPPPLGLTRYGSAPGSFLSGVADSVIGTGGAVGFLGRIHTGEHPSTASVSSSRSSASAVPTVSPDLEHCRSENASWKWSHDVPEVSVPEPESSVSGVNRILRHSSSPAGFLPHLMLDNGFSFPRDFGSCSRPGIVGTASTRLKSQLSFSRRGIPDTGDSAGCSYNSDVTSGSVTQSYMSSNFSISSCGDTNSIIFSAPSSKRVKDNNEEIITISNIEPHVFSLPSTTLDMATMDKYLEFQHDQVPLKVRAKRGCATHPRSIAERERRTRISEKLKRLQELAPNMYKQANTADMLDLAVKHIKELQDQVRVLKKEQENCKCK